MRTRQEAWSDVSVMAKKTKTELVPSGGAKAPATVVALPSWAKELRPDEYAFVLEYIKDFNGRQAAKRAFPHLDDNAAGTKACVWLKRHHISAAVEQAIATVAGSGLRMRLMNEMVAIALHDPGDYFTVDEVTGDVRLKPLDQMTAEQRASIAGFKTKKHSFGEGEKRVEDSEMELKLSDKQGAINTLLKGLGAFREAAGESGATKIAIQVNISNGAAEVL